MDSYFEVLVFCPVSFSPKGFQSCSQHNTNTIQHAIEKNNIVHLQLPSKALLISLKKFPEDQKGRLFFRKTML